MNFYLNLSKKMVKFIYPIHRLTNFNEYKYKYLEDYKQRISDITITLSYIHSNHSNLNYINYNLPPISTLDILNMLTFSIKVKMNDEIQALLDKLYIRPPYPECYETPDVIVSSHCNDDKRYIKNIKTGETIISSKTSGMLGKLVENNIYKPVKPRDNIIFGDHSVYIDGIGWAFGPVGSCVDEYGKYIGSQGFPPYETPKLYSITKIKEEVDEGEYYHVYKKKPCFDEVYNVMLRNKLVKSYKDLIFGREGMIRGVRIANYDDRLVTCDKHQSIELDDSIVYHQKDYGRYTRVSEYSTLNFSTLECDYEHNISVILELIRYAQ